MLWLYVGWRVLRRVWLVMLAIAIAAVVLIAHPQRQLRQAVGGRGAVAHNLDGSSEASNGDLTDTCDLRTDDMTTRRGLSGAEALMPRIRASPSAAGCPRDRSPVPPQAYRTGRRLPGVLADRTMPPCSIARGTWGGAPSTRVHGRISPSGPIRWRS